MELENTQEFLLRECENKIIKRPGKINQLDECLAIHRQYQFLRSERGSPWNNRNLAQQAGMTRRAFLYKKSIGKKINRKLRSMILQNPKVNNFKFLYALSRLPQTQQEILLNKVIAMIKAGATLQKAMISTGLKKNNNKSDEIKVPAGKVPVMIDRTVKEVAEKSIKSELSIEQQIEYLLYMKSIGRECAL